MKSIRWKILMCISLTVAFFMLLLGSVSICLNYRSSIQMLEQTLTETARISAGRLEYEMASYLNVAIDAGCTARLSDPDLDVKIKQAIIQERVDSHGLTRGNLVGADGYSIFDGNSYSDRVYYQKAMAGEAYISEPLISKVTGKYSIIIAAPLWENGIPGSRVVGVVYFVPQETFLNDMMSNVQISPNSAAYVINASGVTIADNTMETILVQNIEEEAKRDPSLSGLAEIHSRMRQGETGFSPYEINGVRKFSAYAPIGGTDGWSIAITTLKSDFMSATYFAIIITVVLLLLSLVITALIAFWVSNSMGRPIEACAGCLSALARGNMRSDLLHIERKDEIGVLADAANSLMTTIRGIIQDMDWRLDEIASGNFAVESRSEDLYVGDFRSLLASVEQILKRLTETMVSINQSADQVASGADQVSAGAQALSQGATEQASSVEELAATVSEISQQVEQTAQGAGQINEKAAQVGGEVSVSNQRMQEMLAAMSEIRTSSQEIGKIIKTIEDIAFQTNILALNAAIEAARAGSAGKGFTVVAGEVRNLAGKSAEASKDTASLIERAIQAVESGTKIAGETAGALNLVVDGVKDITHTIGQISAASAEQANSISQVKIGMDQISSVVQTNSATAEESAAASEELSGQAQILKELVNQFTLKQDRGILE